MVDELQTVNANLHDAHLEALSGMRAADDEAAKLRLELNKRTKNRFQENAATVVVYLLGAGAVAGVIWIFIWVGGAISDCATAPPLTAGYVVSRDYHRAYTTTVCTPTTKTQSCHPVHHPERYSLTLADGHHDERVVDMDEAAWLQHDPGDYMCLHSGACEPPHDDARNR